MKTQSVARGAASKRWGWLIATLACLCVWGPVPAMAQDEAAAEEEKVETKIATVDEGEKLQTKAPTLAGEKAGPQVVKAENFATERKFESLKKIDTQIQKIKKLISITPEDHEDRPEFLFNLAELYFEKSKYYQLKAFETQDRCYGLDDAGASDRDKDLCKRQMQDELKEATRWRADSVEVYKEIITKHNSFANMDEVLYYLGANMMELGKRPDALEVFKRLITNYPKSRFVPNVLVAFGDYYFDADEMGQALKAYDKVTDSYKDSAVFAYATYKKGWCYFNLDDKERALDLFLQALNFSKKRKDLPNSKPLIKQARKDIVMTYAFVGASDKAIKFFKDITDNDREEWLQMGERLAVYYSDKGKFDDSMSMYRELIQLNKESVKTIDYQYEIVRNQTSTNAYSKETLTELVRLMRLVKAADEGKFKDRDEKEKNFKSNRAKVEELERKWAQTYHREAQQTRNRDLYAKAYFLYKEYLDTFGKTATKENAYMMTFFFGELLYKLEKYEDAATNYEAALDLNPKGKYTEEIVLSAVLSYFKLVSVEENKKDLDQASSSLNDEPGEEDDKKKKEPYKKPAPKELPDLHKRLVKACERYITFAPEGEKIVDVKYTRARILYDFDHMMDAGAAFKELAWSHSGHRLAVIAANLHLDALYVMRELDTMEQEVHAYLGENEAGEKVKEPPIKDEIFIEEVTAMAAAIAFKKCTVLDEKERWKPASDCFVAFFRKYTDSEYGDDALYNAALDMERMSEIGKAIQVRVYLLKSYPESKHAPITLYNIAANYHALAIYSQAAKFYELFVRNFPDHEKAEDALRNASTFRFGLGQYDRAIADYERYLEAFGKQKPEEGATVHFQIAKTLEKKGKQREAFEQYEDYLKRWAKSGSDANRLQAHLNIGLYYWGRNGRTNRKKALSEFERTLKEYGKLSDERRKEAGKGAADAAAQAQFMIGENEFEELTSMSINSRNNKELQKKVQQKIQKGQEVVKLFEQVFKYGRPDWTIAAFYRSGAAMEDFAISLRKTDCPRALTYDQCEIYKGLLEDKASGIEQSAVDEYIKALEASQKAKWFNKYTREAEVRLAEIRPRDWRKPSEFRAEPNHIQSGFMGIDFQKEIKDEDRLEDLDRGDGAEETAEAAQ